MVHFSGKARKMNHIPPFLRAKRAIDYLKFEIFLKHAKNLFRQRGNNPY
ncbi:MAG: hypothetical protein U5L45_10550 [Saprospiraceae bacterium]|nr:hypothetical protein [Saprospiraceae bacterium]